MRSLGEQDVEESISSEECTLSTKDDNSLRNGQIRDLNGTLDSSLINYEIAQICTFINACKCMRSFSASSNNTLIQLSVSKRRNERRW